MLIFAFSLFVTHEMEILIITSAMALTVGAVAGYLVGRMRSIRNVSRIEVLEFQLKMAAMMPRLC